MHPQPRQHGQHQNDHHGRGDAHNDEAVGDDHDQHAQEVEEVVGEVEVHHVHVPVEAVGDATHGVHVEEGHRRAHHVLRQLLVVRARGAHAALRLQDEANHREDAGEGGDHEATSIIKSDRRGKKNRVDIGMCQ